MLGLHCCPWAFSSCGERGLLLLWSMCSRRAVFSSCSMQASLVVALGLNCSEACGIFPDEGRIHVPCISRRILNHCATREVRIRLVFIWMLSCMICLYILDIKLPPQTFNETASFRFLLQHLLYLFLLT